jgi:wyosine [tRNA(Phe)-imidazoG37] synthetase (radical SAM superfamily)
MPSLDAGDEVVFRQVNRPHRRIGYDKMLEGLMEFRAHFEKRVWLEVFLLGGITTVESDLRKIALNAKKIGPDKIQINTIARPPAEDYAFAVPDRQMKSFRRLFGKKAEIVAENSRRFCPAAGTASRNDVLSLLRRRPCSLEDVSGGLGMPPNETLKCMDALLKNRLVGIRRRENHELYVLLQRLSARKKSKSS